MVASTHTPALLTRPPPPGNRAGNKIFQSTFISILFPTATEFQKKQYTLLNSAVALMGYYCAAWLVDKTWYGRRRMQNVG
jgi:hypothetical protein